MYLYKTFIIIVLFIEAYSQKLAEQKIESYQSCQHDADCKPNSFCFGNDDTVRGKCKCLDGFELIRNTTFYECLQGVPLGEACEKDIQCTITANLAECNQYKICNCTSEANAYSDGKCYLTVKLREICMTDANCYLGNNIYAFCYLGKCSCAPGQRPSEDNTKCVSRRTMGQECNSDEECLSVPNGRCMGVCRCGGGYTMSRSGKSCVKAATKFGENCTFDGQCSEYLTQSICVEGKCGCWEGQHGYGTKCVYTRKVQERCEEDAQCIHEQKLEQNVQCKSGVCNCIYGESAGVCRIEKKVDKSASDRIRVRVDLLFLLIVKILMSSISEIATITFKK